jgi:hypothetical protein
MPETIDRIKDPERRTKFDSRATLDFIIDERNCEEASFEYYLGEYFNINSITLKSILFYNSW